MLHSVTMTLYNFQVTICYEVGSINNTKTYQLLWMWVHYDYFTMVYQLLTLYSLADFYSKQVLPKYESDFSSMRFVGWACYLYLGLVSDIFVWTKMAVFWVVAPWEPQIFVLSFPRTYMYEFLFSRTSSKHLNVHIIKLRIYVNMFVTSEHGHDR
jgi:hypothetical protein